MDQIIAEDKNKAESIITSKKPVEQKQPESVKKKKNINQSVLSGGAFSMRTLKRNLPTVIILIIVITAVCIGTVFAYYYLFSKDPVSLMLKKVSSLSSVEYKMQLSIKTNQFDDYDLKIMLNGVSNFNRDNERNKTEFEIKGTHSLMDDYQSKWETMNIGKDRYMNINEVSSISPFYEMPIDNQWFISESIDESDLFLSYISFSAYQLQKIIEKRSLLFSITEALSELTDNESVIEIHEPSLSQLGEIETKIYSFELDKEKVNSIINKVKENTNVDSRPDKDRLFNDMNDLLDLTQIENIEIDLWIGEKDKLLYKIAIDSHVKLAALDTIAKVSAVIVLNNHNKEVEIKKPETVISLENKFTKLAAEGIRNGYTDILSAKDRDQDGISNIDEISIYHTDMEKKDSDGDGISDTEEIYDNYKKEFDVRIKSSNIEERLDSIGLYIDAINQYGIHRIENSYDQMAMLYYDPYRIIPIHEKRAIMYALEKRNENDYETSLYVLEDELENTETPGRIYQHLGLTYYGMDNKEKALEYFQKAYDSNFESFLLFHDLFSTNYELGNDDKAVEFIKEGISLYPRYFPFYTKLAGYYIEKDNLDAAQEIIEKGLIVEPRYADFYNSLGIIYKDKKDNQQELESYKKAIENDFHHATAHMNLSILHREDFRETDKARLNANVEAEIANDLDPNNSHIINNLGYTYYTNGNVEWAIINYMKAIELDPAYKIPYNNLAIAYSDQNKFILAEQNYRKALEIDPDYAKVYNNLGFLNIEQNNNIKAIPYLQKAAELDPEMFLPHKNLGIVYMRLSRKEEARLEFELALSLGDPNDSEILNYLDSL